MRHKQKMELINNYVDIYKMLYSCKYLLKNINTSNEGISNSKNILDTIQETLKLKEAYEKSFEKLNISDTSFLVLKRELEKGITHPHSENYTPIDLIKINEANTKIYKKLIDVSFKYKLNI